MKKLLIVIVFSLIFSACGVPDYFVPVYDGTVEDNSGLKHIGYELFYIEGMPCMRIGRNKTDGSNEVYDYDGVTCDWSKWEGNNGR